MADSPICECGTTMVEEFDYRPINELATAAIPTGLYRCMKCGAQSAPLWTCSRCGTDNESEHTSDTFACCLQCGLTKPSATPPQTKGHAMRGDFDEDELDDEAGAYWDEDDICIDCQRTGSMMDECSCCGATMCSACYEMGCGVCKGPHR